MQQGQQAQQAQQDEEGWPFPVLPLFERQYEEPLGLGWAFGQELPPALLGGLERLEVSELGGCLEGELLGR